MLEDFSFNKVAVNVISYNMDTLSKITWPAGMKAYEFETAAETKKGKGAEPNIISGKRRSYSEYERELLEKKVEDLTAQVTLAHAAAKAADHTERITSLETA